MKVWKIQLTPTFRSLKNTVFRAQSTCENRFWSNTLHINSKRSTSHWLYDWLWSSEKSEDVHSRSSTDCTNSLIIGDTLRAEPTKQCLVQTFPSWKIIWRNHHWTYLSVSFPLPVSAVLDGFVLSKLNDFGLSECGDAVVEFAIHALESDNWDDSGMIAAVVELCCCAWHIDAKVVAVTEPPVVWPRAIAIGLGDESGDDVSDDTWGETNNPEWYSIEFSFQTCRICFPSIKFIVKLINTSWSPLV